MASTTIQVLVATWTPVDVAVGEVVTLPSLKPPIGCVVLGGLATVPTPGATLATGIVTLTEPAALFGGGFAVAPGVDDWPTPKTVSYSRMIGSTKLGTGVGTDDPVTLTYAPGATPGATTPTVNFYLMIVPGVFGAAG